MAVSTAYERLPEEIRQYYTEEQYLWLPDDQKDRLVQRETEPEVD